MAKKESARHALRRFGRTALMTLAALAAPKFAHAKYDPFDPLGQMRKRHVEVNIEIAPGNWGTARPADIQMVLASVAQTFLDNVGLRRDALHLRVVPRAGSPRVLYERGADGQYVIQLTARDQRWFQYAYQFAHELCHVVSNFDHKRAVDDEVVQDNQWFEESLCETAALFTLKELSAAWGRHPPTRNWMAYGPSFAAYADHLIDEPHRHLPDGRSLREWYADNRTALKDNPYLREKNEVVASVLLPLFEAHPEFWRSIAYLNPERSSAGKPFPAYLADWYAAAPDKALPRAVMAGFGFDADGAAAASAPHAAALAAGALPKDTAANGPAGD